jgi:hypothetical protein
MNYLDDEGIHNLDNAIEAMEVDFGRLKRARYGESSIKNEGERERSSRVAGNSPPEKEDYPYNGRRIHTMDGIHMPSRTFQMACNAIRSKKCTLVISKKNAEYF